MNLTETTQALEAKGITVAINLGAHQYCAIDSNCPLAVELRRLMIDAGVTLEQLLEGYTAVTATDPVNYDLPGVDGKAIIKIGEKVIEVDLDDIVGNQIKLAMDKKRRELGEQQARINQLGSCLYSSYLVAIQRAREDHTLPQLSFSHKELIASNCLITCEGNTYIFLFPCKYKPEYTVSGNNRYKIADSDIKAIRRDACLEFKVRNKRFISILLLRKTGGILEHYHGNPDGDCWGSVRLPRGWDGTLKNLRDSVKLLMGSLATINMDSVLDHYPTGMPSDRVLQDRATRLGIEGVPEPITAADTGEVEEPARTTWGAGTRAGGAANTTLTEAEEYARRWGVGTFDEANTLSEAGDERAICLLCGEGFNEHNRYTCPRDR